MNVGQATPSANRNSIRLRQYYEQYKNFLAGQTWSAFGDPDAFPDTLEFEGPPGMMATRQPTIRYTQPLGKEHSIAFPSRSPAPTRIA
jgi:hypothetical protein